MPGVAVGSPVPVEATVVGWQNDSGNVVVPQLNSSGELPVSASISSSGGAIEDGADPSIKATVQDYTNSNPLAVVLTNTSGTAYTASGTASAGTSTLSNVSDSASSVTVLSANAARLGFMLYNDSSAVAYVKLGTTASATSFTQKLIPQETWTSGDIGTIYTGRIDAIWASAPGGAMRVTELTA